jgi:hypothetical protein
MAVLDEATDGLAAGVSSLFGTREVAETQSATKARPWGVGAKTNSRFCMSYLIANSRVPHACRGGVARRDVCRPRGCASGGENCGPSSGSEPPSEPRDGREWTRTCRGPWEWATSGPLLPPVYRAARIARPGRTRRAVGEALAGTRLFLGTYRCQCE